MKQLLLSVALLLTITACSNIYSPSATINIDSSKVNFSELNTKKKIKDCNWGFLGVMSNHDITTLMNKNNVSKMYWVDYELGNILLWSKHCVIIYAD